jgi:hypothetical protein
MERQFKTFVIQCSLPPRQDVQLESDDFLDSVWVILPSFEADTSFLRVDDASKSLLWTAHVRFDVNDTDKNARSILDCAKYPLRFKTKIATSAEVVIEGHFEVNPLSQKTSQPTIRGIAVDFRSLPPQIKTTKELLHFLTIPEESVKQKGTVLNVINKVHPLSGETKILSRCTARIIFKPDQVPIRFKNPRGNITLVLPTPGVNLTSLRPTDKNNSNTTYSTLTRKQKTREIQKLKPKSKMRNKERGGKHLGFLRNLNLLNSRTSNLDMLQIKIKRLLALYDWLHHRLLFSPPNLLTLDGNSKHQRSEGQN